MAIALSASGCTAFTRSSMADGRLAGSICSQLNIELAHRGAKTSGRMCDSLHNILYDGCIVAQSIQINEPSGVLNVVYNQAVGLPSCQGQ